MSTPAIAEKGGTTRERLLRVAIEMFAERGYAASGVDALCRRAGVAKTGLYWEFQNKAGLLNAVIDHVVAGWVVDLRNTVAQSADPRERLDLALATLRRRMKDRPEFFRVILVVLAERTQVDDDARDALRRLFETARGALVRVIQEATVTKLPEPQLEAAADLILAMIQGAFLRLQVLADDAEIDRLFDGIRRSILLIVRELIANAHGRSTLVGRVTDLAKPTE